LRLVTSDRFDIIDLVADDYERCLELIETYDDLGRIRTRPLTATRWLPKGPPPPRRRFSHQPRCGRDKAPSCVAVGGAAALSPSTLNLGLRRPRYPEFRS
jgi:hypothetical protein